MKLYSYYASKLPNDLIDRCTASDILSADLKVPGGSREICCIGVKLVLFDSDKCKRVSDGSYVGGHAFSKQFDNPIAAIHYYWNQRLPAVSFTGAFIEYSSPRQHSRRQRISYMNYLSILKILFPQKPTLEEFIKSHEPTSIAQIEELTKQYERMENISRWNAK